MDTLTTKQAWSDFYAWIKTTPRWKKMDAPEKQKIKNTGQDVKRGAAGDMRVGRCFEKYRPGHYQLNETWTVKNDD